MERRTFDSPMDFEYENRKAQVPADSPWLKGTKNLFQRSNFRSPMKSEASHQILGMTNPPPQTPIKNHVALFRENPATDFSSGGENASSPEADNEDTPDRKQSSLGLNENITLFRGNHASPSKSNSRPASPTKSSARASFSNWVSRLSPSHKPLIRKDQTRHAPLTKRPPKRKRRELEQDVTQDSGSEYDTDTNSLATVRPLSYSPRKTSNSNIEPTPAELGTIPAILKFINDHPSLPHILSWWAQMLISSFVMIGVIYILYSFWSAIQRDVDLKAEELSADLLREIGLCSENFIAHDCLKRETLGLRFKAQCDDWEACMKQDHRAVGRAKISVSTWAEIINGFVEPLSGKIIFLGVALFTISIAVPHVLFGLIRQKNENSYPATMGRSASGGSFNENAFATNQEQYFTPMHNRSYDAFSAQGMASGRQSPNKANRMVEGGSPVRRIQYR